MRGSALWSQFSPSIFTWVLGIELRSAGLHDNCFYLVIHRVSPCLSASTVLALPGTLVGFVSAAAAPVALTRPFVLYERTRD